MRGLSVACIPLAMDHIRYIYRTPRWAKGTFCLFVLASFLTFILFQIQKRTEYQKLSLENSLQPSILTVAQWPKMDAYSLSGSLVPIGSSKEWALVHYWATWCVPCQHELPALNEFSARFDGKIAVFAISVDENLEKLRTYMADHPANNLRILHDPGQAAKNLLGVSKYPETFLLSPDGQIHAHFSGPRSWQDPSVARYFEALISTS